MKREFFAVVALVFTMFSVTPFLGHAEETAEEETKIELSNDDYEEYVKSVIRPSFFDNFLNTMTAKADDYYITENKFAMSPAPKPNNSSGGLGVASSLVQNFGEEVIKDIINNATVDNSGGYLPEYTQIQGKLRINYVADNYEIVTCCLTKYQTPVNNILTGNTTGYTQHCIISFVREMGDYYTIFSICDTDSTAFAQSYNIVGTVSLADYSILAQYSCNCLLYGGSTATQTGIGQTVQYNFADTNQSNPEWNVSTSYVQLGFYNFPQSGIPYTNRNYDYLRVSDLVSPYNRWFSNQTGGACFSTSYIDTNNQQLAFNAESYNQTNNPISVNFRSEINNQQIINNFTVSNINDFMSINNDTLTINNSNYNSWASSQSTAVYNNTVNNYMNYYSDAPPTEPTTEPTEPTTEPTEPTTEPTEPTTEPTEPTTEPTEDTGEQLTFYIPEVDTDFATETLPTFPEIVTDDIYEQDAIDFIPSAVREGDDILKHLGVRNIFVSGAVLSAIIKIIRRRGD